MTPATHSTLDPDQALHLARETFDIEASALRGLAARVDARFVQAVQRVLQTTGRVVVMGMGKSGHIGRKIAATLASTGTPAFFVHPAEASHGDLGMVTGQDLVLAISNSGESGELTALLPVLKRLGVPLIAMTYANIAFRTGARRFAAEAVESGISGVILPDVPIEELGAWEPAAQGAGLQTVLLASPVNSDERLDEICRRAEGFVYGVNLLGVTGERADVGERASTLARKLKAITDMPVVMGFGVSNGDQARELTAIADGVVVGSAVVQRVLDGASPTEMGRFIAELRAALDA